MGLYYDFGIQYIISSYERHDLECLARGGDFPGPLNEGGIGTMYSDGWCLQKMRHFQRSACPCESMSALLSSTQSSCHL